MDGWMDGWIDGWMDWPASKHPNGAILSRSSSYSSFVWRAQRTATGAGSEGLLGAAELAGEVVHARVEPDQLRVVLVGLHQEEDTQELLVGVRPFVAEPWRPELWSGGGLFVCRCRYRYRYRYRCCCCSLLFGEHTQTRTHTKTSSGATNDHRKTPPPKKPTTTTTTNNKCVFSSFPHTRTLDRCRSLA